MMVRGQGCFLYDETGKEYLDGAAGIATNALGHNHPAMIEALQDQAQRLWHCSNMYRNPALEAFADALIAISHPARKVFFCSSGSEAVETAIKTIRRYHHVRADTERTEILVVDGGFHGRTTGALAACSNPASKEGYAPLMQGFRTIPFHDLEALERAIGAHTAAILLEPIQGEGGVRVHDASYLQQLRHLCSTHGALLCLDEVQCGYGRTGSMYAFQQSNITPDLWTVAKGIGGGFPLAAMLATEEVASCMTQGTHGGTYGGNPLACAVGLSVLNIVQSEGFLAQVQRVGDYFYHHLQQLHQRHPHIIAEVRGRGLMLGLSLHPAIDKYAFTDALRHKGLLLAPAVSHVVRIVPPLIFETQHVDQACRILEDVCRQWI
ncbi:MAG: aspartate aminotransferase family protein [Alphaproteobacteria bacterium]|nr:MAG: aspartate aminotransferase family protein [Alphaproteobacteria bacterium]